jgi:hypothetical protein
LLEPLPPIAPYLVPNNPLGDDFKIGGGDLIAPAASGTYKIEVNFQTGKFKLTKL